MTSLGPTAIEAFGYWVIQILTFVFALMAVPFLLVTPFFLVYVLAQWLSKKK